MHFGTQISKIRDNLYVKYVSIIKDLNLSMAGNHSIEYTTQTDNNMKPRNYIMDKLLMGICVLSYPEHF